MTAKARTWFIPTSPRSPHKIRNELELLSKLEGCDWNEKDDDGNLINQLKFAEMLRKSTFFEGNISDGTPALSARDRCRPMWMLGFAYKDPDKILRITPAGKRLIEGDRVEQLFLKQLLKLQFPSWQHGGLPNQAWRYPVEEMGCHPFIETLKVVPQVGGVTKKELAMFLLPCLEPSDFQRAICKIREFREEKSKKTPGTPKKDFIFERHLEEFSDVYEEDIEEGETQTRETRTDNVRDFLKKKRRNSIDYADATIRYFQYTGLFTLSRNKLVTSPQRVDDREKILDELDIDVVSFYDDLEEFYNYLGDPDIPQLPWETISQLDSRVGELSKKIENRIKEIKTFDSEYNPGPIPKSPTEKTVDNLSKYESELRDFRFKVEKDYMSFELQKKEKVEEIIDYYEDILAKEVTDPSTHFEWNTWRAVLALDDCIARANFKMDEELNPLSHAGGNMPDVEAYYENENEYVVLFEVTLSGGARQYDTEGEPVSRHVAEFQKDEERDVYALFIAPEIDSNTPEYFHVYFQDRKHPACDDYLNIIPLELNYFLDFLKFCIENDCFTSDFFEDLLTSIKDLRGKDVTSSKWHKLVKERINSWKENYG